SLAFRQPSTSLAPHRSIVSGETGALACGFSGITAQDGTPLRDRGYSHQGNTRLLPERRTFGTIEPRRQTGLVPRLPHSRDPSLQIERIDLAQKLVQGRLVQRTRRKRFTQTLIQLGVPSIRRGDREAEGAALEMPFVAKAATWVRIPPSPLNRNTVRQVITTVSAKVFFKGGRPRCSGRFLANLDILRLTTRGLTRLRRGST